MLTSAYTTTTEPTAALTPEAFLTTLTEIWPRNPPQSYTLMVSPHTVALIRYWTHVGQVYRQLFRTSTPTEHQRRKVRFAPPPQEISRCTP